MALTNAYLVTTKNLDSFLNALRSAKAPERFTNKFLGQLDFTSSNDRLYIGLMKALGFIDESGVPSKRYYAFLDQGESGRVLAEAIREAYEDLFAVNKKAHELPVEEVKNKLKTLTQGQKSENVVSLMASTFKALVSYADWSGAASNTPIDTPHTSTVTAPQSAPAPSEPAPRSRQDKAFQLHYDIHVHLPESRDPAVFDAIFEAMKKHLG